MVKLNPATVLRLCTIKHRKIKLLTSLVFEVLFRSRIVQAGVKNNVLKLSFQHRC